MSEIEEESRKETNVALVKRVAGTIGVVIGLLAFLVIGIAFVLSIPCLGLSLKRYSGDQLARSCSLHPMRFSAGYGDCAFRRPLLVQVESIRRVSMFQTGFLIVIAYFVLMAIFASWAE